MENDELYPTGWSHRKFYPAKKNNNNVKKLHVDPVMSYLPGAQAGGLTNVNM